MENKIIMVVDDDIDVQDFCKIVLGREDYQVITFSNSESALEYLSSNTPSVIITDLMMGGIDEGVQFVNKIRGFDNEKAKIPIIMITGINSKLGYDITPRSDEEKKQMKID
ncbi:MAG: response regulator, partial [Candidatus Hydrogenedens sp.]